MAEAVATTLTGNTLADILELVLEKGVVIAGDIVIKLADVELLTIKISLLIAGVDKAKEMGIKTKDAFPAIYLAFIGKDHGPRAAWFLLQYPKEKVLARLKEASK